MFKVLFLIFVVIAVTDAAECPTDYCSKHPCRPKPTCTDREILRPNATYCGCCDMCVIQLDKGDPCRTPEGFPPMYECSAGLTCVNGVCE